MKGSNYKCSHQKGAYTAEWKKKFEEGPKRPSQGASQERWNLFILEERDMQERERLQVQASGAGGEIQEEEKEEEGEGCPGDVHGFLVGGFSE